MQKILKQFAEDFMHLNGIMNQRSRGYKIAERKLVNKYAEELRSLLGDTE